MFKKKKVLFFLGLAIPTILVFRALFTPGPLAWADAPFYYPEELSEMASKLFSWTEKETNFGGANRPSWLYPIMFLIGTLHAKLGISNDLLIRLAFYFPSLLLSLVGPVLLTRYLKFSKTVQFFTSLVYSLNTYYILLVDGGQAGVFLAYGIFPLALLSLKRLFDLASVKNLYKALLFTFLLTVADPRFLVLVFATFVVWVLVESLFLKNKRKRKPLFSFVLLATALFLFSLYWLVPALTLGFGKVSLSVSGLRLFSFVNGLTLFQPHWPLNQFGIIFSPPLYFFVVPLLIFGAIFFAKRKETSVFLVLFLIFVFLLKGEAPPLGQIYGFVVNKLPFGFIFRDSSKFFIPLFIFGGILIGKTAEGLSKPILKLGIYLYLLFLILPAILGQLSGTLAGRSFNQEFLTIKENITKEEGFIRTAWFSRRHPFSFHLEDKPSLDAIDLIEKRPFASMNAGTYDHFNFLNSKKALEWFDLLGIKYLVFPEDAYKTKVNQEELVNKENLLSLVEDRKDLARVDWQTDIPVFKLENVSPRVFGFEKLLAIVGGDDIYSKISPKEFGTLFLEDGQVNPRTLENVSPETVSLVFNNKDRPDLTMSFLRDYFVFPSGTVASQWALYQKEEYLIYKYQLLIRDLEIKDFDYGGGIAFSTQPGEKIEFDILLEKVGDYVLAIRSMGTGEALRYTLDDEEGYIEETREESFSWFLKPVTLSNKKTKLVIENTDGLKVLNAVAIIPKAIWEEAEGLSAKYVDKFEILSTNDIVSTGTSNIKEVFHQRIDPVNFSIRNIEEINWIVVTNSYHFAWELRGEGRVEKPQPLYSMVNAYYAKDLNEGKIIFTAQEKTENAFTLSVLTVVALTGVFIGKRIKKK